MWSDLYIRSQVRLKHFDARKCWYRIPTERQRIGGISRSSNPPAGNVAEAETAMDRLLQTDAAYLNSFIADRDIGPGMATPAFAAWREKHASPASQATTTRSSR